ncbi:hypothetical protein I3760_03G265200 [Carya illinoinensis]|nr:hypothetical protein I3760_03G265200 [Carya illinoinensis]
MKKLCKKGQVHPSPPSISDHLAVLPATILTLTAALSAEDKEVLAYLIIISSSINTSTSSNFSGHDPEAVIPRCTHGTDQGSTDYHSGWGDHTPMFECNCFRCYMSFWARWDASPSRELIHEIIEAYEDDQLVKKKRRRRSAKMKKAERKKIATDESKGTGDQEGSGNRSAISRDEVGESVSVDASGSTSTDGVKVTSDHVEVGWVGMRGCVRKIASFIGEKIWAGVWIN